MAMAAPNMKPGSASERIWRYIAGRPTNPDGAVYFRPALANAAAAAGTGHTTAALGQWEKQGSITVLRHGRRVVGARSKVFAPKGSLIDRISDVLIAYADEKGRVDIDVQRIERLVHGRNSHDIKKALFDLKERGFLSMKDFKEEGGVGIRDIRIRPNTLAKEFTDDIEPVPAIVVDPESYTGSRHREGPAPVLDAPVEVRSTAPPIGMSSPFHHDEPDPASLSVTQGGIGHDSAQFSEPPVEPEPEPVVETTATLPKASDPWTERYPLIAAVMEKVNRQKAVRAAAEALSAAGPDFEDEALAVMEKAGAMFSDFEEEVVRFVEEVVQSGQKKE